MNKYHIISLIFFLFINLSSKAQIPVPADEQDSTIVLIGGTVHTGNDTAIQNAYVMFEKGIITKIGAVDSLPDIKNAIKINTEKQHIYPGLILPNSDIGLNDIDAIRASRDDIEVGTFNPNIRSIIAYNTDSEIIPALRFNGILLAQCTPQGGYLSGKSSIVMLDGWNWEDASYKKDIGIHLRWPSYKTPPRGFSSSIEIKPNKKYNDAVTIIKEFFTEAKAYSEIDEPLIDIET